ncbi:hypothetical protein BT63DRAFT_450021 [Microthyrium microscopicum]|uniref:Pre-mRNA-splicing factor CWC24 n=1 Tax=Microthyrium microscopicum TaxID=703497 RepID=A0A6A6URW9_9PEZI|nr:hypothetical protein BT63DRAFT_450021 [Microthyrium microscopicum]
MADTSPPVAVFKKRTTKNLRKRPATPPPASSSDEEYSSTDEAGHRIKRRRRAGVAAGSTTHKAGKDSSDLLSTTKYAADRSTLIADSNDATKQSNWYDEHAPDALSAKSLLGTTRAKPAVPDQERDGAYHGQAGYTNFIAKNPNKQDKGMGPVKAPTNLRAITITDYSPDVCKDYKQTGFCGFGDNCKYLHTREVYKQGWALDKEWEIQTRGKKLKGTVVASANRSAIDEEEEKDAELLEKIPFACIICKGPYKNPVVTKCGHYYCESCALQKYQKNPSCVACGAGTNGVFNTARNLNKLLERKKKREERLKELEQEDEDEE